MAQQEAAFQLGAFQGDAFQVVGVTMRRFEESTAGSFARTDVQRFEQSTPGVFKETDT